MIYNIAEVTLILCLGIVLAQPLVLSEGAADYTRSTDKSYAEVLGTMRAAASEQGFPVYETRDIAARGPHEPYTTLEICDSPAASELLAAKPRLGLLMPCRIAIYKTYNKTTVSMMLPTKLIPLLGEEADAKFAAERLEHAMRAIVDAATGS